MADESKINDPAADKAAAAELIEEAKGTKDSNNTNVAADSDNDDEQDAATIGTSASGPASKKKKSKKKRIKTALGVGSNESSSGSSSKDDVSRLIHGLSAESVGNIFKNNPALAQQLGVGQTGDLTDAKAVEALKSLKLEDIMTGLASSGKNKKDMASYKFWQTQPVPKFGESSTTIEEGPFKMIDPEQVPKEPGPLIDGFEWVTMDLTKDEEIEEIFTLLYGHYVEDDEAMFRFNYSKSFLKW